MIRTRVGYSGGTTPHPTYRSLGDHTETVQLDYDPTKISYQDLLRVFWTGHDPYLRTWSTQYASLVFAHTDEQRRLAEASKAELERTQRRTVHTGIRTYEQFVLAEDYHQKHSLRQFPEFEEELRRTYPLFADYVASTAVARVNGYLGGEGACDRLVKEADHLGLSTKRRDQLLQVVRMQKGSAACPVPGKSALPATP